MKSKLVGNDVFRRLCISRDFIQDCHADSVSIEILSKKACLSPYHFLRIFTQTFGETPHAYLTRIRLERAKHLLMAENMPITDVCMEVGFSSLGSFSTLFSREFGCSPSVFRREMGRIYQIPFLYSRTLIPHCFLHKFGGPDTK